MTVSDLSPGALKQLEAKLEAELVIVRKVLAMLEEHALSTGQPSPALQAAAVAPSVISQQTGREDPEAPTRAAVEMMDGVFELKTVRALLESQRKVFYDPQIRGVLNMLVRQGVLAVVQHRTGRGGCTYRRL